MNYFIVAFVDEFYVYLTLYGYNCVECQRSGQSLDL